jgi:hypothetical protein
MPNVEPSVKGCEGCLEWSTVPEPSKLECFPASATNANICAAGASTTRSTLMVFPSTRLTLSPRV